ncbi:MAG TPA: metallopeptidase family protein [Actinomycetales bacterium]
MLRSRPWSASPSGSGDASSAGSPAGARPGAGRRRDRHGRGLRGALTPASLPGHRTRAEQFDDLVLDAVELLERRWAAQLSGVEFAVEDVPPSDPAPWEHGEVPLGRLFPASGALATRIVVYRRPVETRAPEPALLAPMVHEVVVEQVAHLLGVEPSAVDPTLDDD